jgi:hypothetical protein
MFEKEAFVEDCRAALKEDDTHSSIRELVTKAVTSPSEIIRASESLSVPASRSFTEQTI